MKTEYIKAFDGHILGIVEYSSNGDITVRDFSSRMILGYYRKAHDWTTDFYGRVIARGNTVVSLIYQQHK